MCSCLSYEIGGFCGCHYLEKESISALDFYQRKSHQGKETLLFVQCRQPRSNLPGFAMDLWSCHGCMIRRYGQISPSSTNVPFTDKSTRFVQFFDLHLYLKCHSSTGVFQTFY